MRDPPSGPPRPRRPHRRTRGRPLAAPRHGPPDGAHAPRPAPRRRRRGVRRQHRARLDRLAARRRRPPRADRRRRRRRPRRGRPRPARRWTSAARPPTPPCAMAYLAHIEVTADHVDGAMLLAVDASLLTESPAAGGPSRALQEAHRWLSLALSGLDLEELALGHAVRGQHVAAALRDPERPVADAAARRPQHVELAQTQLPPRRRRPRRRTGRRGDRVGHLGPGPRRTSPIPATTTCSTSSRRGRWSAPATSTTRSGRCAGSAGTCRRSGGMWLRAYTDLVLARLLARLAERDDDGEQRRGVHRAAGRRRGCLRWPPATAAATASACSSSAATRPTWAAPPRRCTGWRPTAPTPAARTPAAGELWAEMFVRRSRLREAERQAAHAAPARARGPAHRPGQPAQRRAPAGRPPAGRGAAVAGRRRRRPVQVGQRRRLAHPGRRRPAAGRRPAARAQPHRRRGLPLGRRRVPGRAADGDRGAGRRRHGAAPHRRRRRRLERPASSPSRSPCRIGVATAPAADEAERRPGPVVGWRALFDTADLHLFSAKRGGRNRVRAPGAGQPDENADDGSPASTGEEQ